VVREADLPELSVVTFPAYTDTSVNARDAVSAAREARAAVATYADLDTCAECGATHQYGAYCGDCGEAMTDAAATNKFCTTCGQELGDDRANHVCTETGSAAPSTEPRDNDLKPEVSTSGSMNKTLMGLRLVELKGVM
jgi:NADH pyrophosphatase NudC (nudix superfamily)